MMKMQQEEPLQKISSPAASECYLHPSRWICHAGSPPNQPGANSTTLTYVPAERIDSASCRGAAHGVFLALHPVDASTEHVH